MRYIITNQTLLLINSNKHTKIYEINSFKIVNEEINSIISNNCIINGSTLDGRQKASSALTGCSYKLPIIISDAENLIFIPTHSTRNKANSWVSLNNIVSYGPKKKGTIIEFSNNEKIYLNVSYNVFDNQVIKATRLESALRGRNNKKYL